MTNTCRSILLRTYQMRLSARATDRVTSNSRMKGFRQIVRNVRVESSRVHRIVLNVSAARGRRESSHGHLLKGFHFGQDAAQRLGDLYETRPIVGIRRPAVFHQLIVLRHDGHRCFIERW